MEYWVGVVFGARVAAALFSYGPYGYGLYTYGPYGYGLYTYGTYGYVMAYVVIAFAHTVMLWPM